MIVVGLGHRARSGKDTVAAHLVKHHGFKAYALATKLKQSVNIVMGWDDRHSYGDLKEVVDPFWNVTPRWVYQNIGTEGWRKIIGPKVWAQALKKQLLDENPERVVITDVRFFDGEIELIEELGGFTVRVDRPGLKPLVVPPSSAVGRFIDRLRGKSKLWTHQSEWDLVNYTGWKDVLDNSGSLEQLYHRTDALIDKHIG
jgi:hypothetical protein